MKYVGTLGVLRFHELNSQSHLQLRGNRCKPVIVWLSVALILTLEALGFMVWRTFS